MGREFLEIGQMITGKYGHRYLVRSQILDNGTVQMFEISEADKLFLAVINSKATLRIKTEQLEQEIDAPGYTKEFAWPVDVFNVELRDKKVFGYIVEMDSGFKLLDVDELQPNERLKVGFGITKSFSKLHLNGFTYLEVPTVFVNDKLEVRLVAVPIFANSKFAKSDIIGVPGISAPELYAVAAVRMTNLATDRFLLASVLFLTLTGQKPYKETSDISLAYVYFSYSESYEVLVEKYGHRSVEGWRCLTDELKAMFIKNFTDGVSNIEARFDPDDWAIKLEDNFIKK